MGLFDKKTEQPPPEPQKKGLFDRNRNSTDQPTSPDRSSKGGIGNILHPHEDKSIRDARERVLNAEKAEREADKALMEARQSVRDARAHVKKLELEAEAE